MPRYAQKELKQPKRDIRLSNSAAAKRVDAMDVCDRCQCARVPDDDDARHWKVMRGRRVCGARVFERALATAERERWWKALAEQPGAHASTGDDGVRP